MSEKPVTDRANAVDVREAPDAPETSDALVSTEQLADLQRERDDYYDRWVRKTAEFDNYRKRVDRERREQRDQAVVDLLLDLLLVVDDFDRALTIEAGPGSAAYRKGIELMYAKLHDLLRKQG